MVLEHLCLLGEDPSVPSRIHHGSLQLPVTPASGVSMLSSGHRPESLPNIRTGAFNPSTWVAETGGQGVQCQPGLREAVSDKQIAQHDDPRG